MDEYEEVGWFNQPWMDRVNPDLLLRYWRKKNTLARLLYRTEFGVEFMVYSTKWGEFWSMPLLKRFH